MRVGEMPRAEADPETPGSSVAEDDPVVRLVHHFRRTAARFAAAGLNLLFPPRCLWCQADLPPSQDGLLVCADCRLLLAPKLWPCCPRCGAAGGAEGEPSGGCRLCRGRPLKFDAVVTLGAYDPGLRKVVLRMKRRSGEALSAAMGRLLALRRGPQLAELSGGLIVPVPMYWTRRLVRGTNSPEIVANYLGRSLGVPVVPRVLSRCRNTLPQASLSPRERFRNVRGAFRVRAGYHLAGLRVLLVDDILTTGATCSEAAKVLKQAGAILVAAVVVARAQGPDLGRG
jgi:ComF family protein